VDCRIVFTLSASVALAIVRMSKSISSE